MSRMLHRQDARLPDLYAREDAGRVIFIPSGGHLALWAHRLARLGLAEFHLSDRESPPATAQRQAIVATINQGPVAWRS